MAKCDHITYSMDSLQFWDEFCPNLPKGTGH